MARIISLSGSREISDLYWRFGGGVLYKVAKRLDPIDMNLHMRFWYLLHYLAIKAQTDMYQRAFAARIHKVWMKIHEISDL